MLINTRIRNTIVTDVASQDSITVRLGGNSASAEFTAVREASTTTRGTLFVQQ